MAVATRVIVAKRDNIDPAVAGIPHTVYCTKCGAVPVNPCQCSPMSKRPETRRTLGPAKITTLCCVKTGANLGPCTDASLFFLAVLQPLKLTGRPQCSRDNSVAWEEKDDVMKADKPPIWASGEHLQNVGTPPVQAEALARGSCVHA